jgi:hypothetical protein
MRRCSLDRLARGATAASKDLLGEQLTLSQGSVHILQRQALRRCIEL